MKIELTEGQVRLVTNMINIELKELNNSVYFKPELEKLKLALTIPVVMQQSEQLPTCKKCGYWLNHKDGTCLNEECEDY